MVFMKKRGKKEQEFAEEMRKINKSMVIEIFVLIYFILSFFLKVPLFMSIPILIIVFGFCEFKIHQAKTRIGFGKEGQPYRITGIIIILLGFFLLISSPFFVQVMEMLAIPITLIVVGVFIFLLSKFYDNPKAKGLKKIVD